MSRTTDTKSQKHAMQRGATVKNKVRASITSSLTIPSLTRSVFIESTMSKVPNVDPSETNVNKSIFGSTKGFAKVEASRNPPTTNRQNHT